MAFEITTKDDKNDDVDDFGDEGKNTAIIGSILSS